MKVQNVNLQTTNNFSTKSKFKGYKLDHYISLFDDYLENQKSLSAAYRHFVCSIARLFLQFRFGSRAINMSRINVNDIRSFIYQYAQHDSPYRTRNMASAFRSFLRFLKFKDMVDVDFSAIIPPVAIWKMDRIPDFLSEQEVKVLLKHCDTSTKIGLRDYTILRMLLSLGLRASEVANLTLDDFDWNNGELIVKGKGSKISRLPLAQDFGDDLVAYLLKGRPSCSSRNIFISANQPYHSIRGHTISSIVGTALKRAGLKKKGKAHLLRHTLATMLLNKGATLQQIGEVLRHRSIDTTAIYAKVDFNKLRSLALPWPGNLTFGGKL
jgi:site-specific recombinase XerD